MQIKILVLTFILFTTSAFASDTVKLGAAGSASVKSIVDEDGAYVSVRTSSGEQRIPEVDYFGKDFYTFHFNGKETDLAIFDVDGDGVQEFMVRTMATPMMSAVYIYKWDNEEKKFSPIPFGKKDFLGAGTGDLKLVAKEGKPASITFDVQQLAEFGNAPKQSFTYSWSNGSFKKSKK